MKPESKNLKPQRDAKGRILKGSTGNSGGLTSEQRAARDALNSWLAEDAQQQVGKASYFRLLHEGNPVIVIDFMNRTAGKPKEALEITGEDGGPVQVASIDVRKLDAKGIEALRLLRAQMEGAP